MQESKKSVFPLFKANILLMAFFLLLYLTIMLPVIFAALNALSSFSLTESLLPKLDAIGNLHGIFNWIYQLAVLLISPFTMLIAPAIVFGKKGAIEGMRTAFSMATKNFLRNIAFVFVIWIATVFVGIIFAIIALIPIVILALFSAIAGGILLLLVLAVPIIALLFLAFISWMIAFTNLATVKYYEYAKANS
jgi:hypothetical protein